MLARARVAVANLARLADTELVGLAIGVHEDLRVAVGESGVGEDLHSVVLVVGPVEQAVSGRGGDVVVGVVGDRVQAAVCGHDEGLTAALLVPVVGHVGGIVRQSVLGVGVDDGVEAEVADGTSRSAGGNVDSGSRSDSLDDDDGAGGCRGGAGSRAGGDSLDGGSGGGHGAGNGGGEQGASGRDDIG